jgi:hypothetical protein
MTTPRQRSAPANCRGGSHDELRGLLDILVRGILNPTGPSDLVDTEWPTASPAD